MRKTTFSLFLTCLFVTLCAGQTASQDGVPFKFQNGFVIVDARIKGDTPVQVVISTGTEYSIIDSDQIKKHKLEVSYTSAAVVTSRTANDGTYTFVQVSSVSLQGSKSTDLQMRVGSMKKVSDAAGTEIFGALAADFFSGQIVQFDFKKNMIRFLDKSPAKDQQAVSGNNGPVFLRMGEKADRLGMKTFVVPLVEGVKINGKETKLLIDTGRAAPVALSASSANKAGLTPPPENEPPRADKLSLDLAGSQIPDLPVLVMPKGAAAEKSLSGQPAIAGTAFLKEFLVTLDFKNKVVILERQ